MPTAREPLPNGLFWLLLAAAPQIIVSLALASPGVWSQVAALSALMAISAVFTLGLVARSWSDMVARRLAGRTVWLGVVLVAGLDAYICARQVLAVDRPTAVAAALFVVALCVVMGRHVGR